MLPLWGKHHHQHDHHLLYPRAQVKYLVKSTYRLRYQLQKLPHIRAIPSTHQRPQTHLPCFADVWEVETVAQSAAAAGLASTQSPGTAVSPLLPRRREDEQETDRTVDLTSPLPSSYASNPALHPPASNLRSSHSRVAERYRQYCGHDYRCFLSPTLASFPPLVRRSWFVMQRVEVEGHGCERWLWGKAEAKGMTNKVMGKGKAGCTQWLAALVSAPDILRVPVQHLRWSVIKSKCHMDIPGFVFSCRSSSSISDSAEYAETAASISLICYTPFLPPSSPSTSSVENEAGNKTIGSVSRLANAALPVYLLPFFPDSLITFPLGCKVNEEEFVREAEGQVETGGCRDYACERFEEGSERDAWTFAGCAVGFGVYFAAMG
ncbi:hypothetical protein ONZ45_g9801 [Pleurotus djamor]|nr:hypothetical protein ONZ45_g9801 [Pleurotus djamor]